ncbi:MAG: zinc metalloprotease HtpX, partial [Gammaproteobacteria bacterium]
MNAIDWRAQLARNERRTHVVIFLFIGIYLLLGLLIDIYISQETQEPFIPLVTLLMGAIATISLGVTYAFHDRLMLLGTEYQE